MCERRATCKSSTHLDQFSVALELFLDDAFRCFAAKNQLSHCNKRKRHDAHNVSQHTVTARKQHSNFKAPKISRRLLQRENNRPLSCIQRKGKPKPSAYVRLRARHAHRTRKQRARNDTATKTSHNE
jgi:hypothetical protein